MSSKLKFVVEKIPKKISPCPIVQAGLELRFEPKAGLPYEAVSGMLFNHIEGMFPKMEPLPIMELPAIIRTQDRELKFKPHYILSKDNFNLKIGPCCFFVSCETKYVGWSKYFELVKDVFNRLNNSRFLESKKRIGLCYISFFKDINIFEKIDVNLSIAKNCFLKKKNTLESQFDEDEFLCGLKLSNDVTLIGKRSQDVSVQNKEQGSIVEINIIKEKDLENFEKIVADAHNIEKKIFFSILKQEFLDEYNPQY